MVLEQVVERCHTQAHGDLNVPDPFVMAMMLASHEGLKEHAKVTSNVSLSVD